MSRCHRKGSVWSNNGKKWATTLSCRLTGYKEPPTNAPWWLQVQLKIINISRSLSAQICSAHKFGWRDFLPKGEYWLGGGYPDFSVHWLSGKWSYNVVCMSSVVQKTRRPYGTWKTAVSWTIEPLSHEASKHPLVNARTKPSYTSLNHSTEKLRITPSYHIFSWSFEPKSICVNKC